MTRDARHWLRRHFGVPLPSPFDAFEIGRVLGEEDRATGREDPWMLREFGFSEAELAKALEGWRRGLRRGEA